MKRLLLITLTVTVCLATLLSCNRQMPVEQFAAGVSAAPINPPLGAFIAGDKQNRTFTSVHDSLFAKAVVFRKGSEEIALVTLDCIGLLYPDVVRIREQAARLCGIPAERIVVSSTHTHSGPDVVGIWGSDYEHSGVDSAYMAFLVRTTAEQISKARATLQPVQLFTATTQFGEPWVQNICLEEIDRTVSILQVRSSDNMTLATLTNFACHPTFLDARFSAVSADYVGGYYREMKKQTRAEAFFLQGAIGGWVQPEDGEGSFEKAQLRGQELASAVLNATAQAQPLQGDRLRFASKRIKFPVENEAWKQLSAIGTIKRSIQDSVETEIAWFAIGNAQFATHPGETAPYYGLETRKMLGSGPTFVVGLGNDALGYILKPSFFENPSIPHAPYLTGMSVGKPTAPLLMQELRSLIPEK